MRPTARLPFGGRAAVFVLGLCALAGCGGFDRPVLSVSALLPSMEIGKEYVHLALALMYGGKRGLANFGGPQLENVVGRPLPEKVPLVLYLPAETKGQVTVCLVGYTDPNKDMKFVADGEGEQRVEVAEAKEYPIEIRLNRLNSGMKPTCPAMMPGGGPPMGGQ